MIQLRIHMESEDAVPCCNAGWAARSTASSWVTPTPPQQRQSAIRDVAAASVLAALEVYESMEAAALTVTKASGDATSGFIQHKWVPHSCHRTTGL